MLMDMLKAILVGIAASVPVGPIAILIIQRTLSKGFRNGFVTSLGSTVVDTMFAIIAIFALAYVQSFIEGNPIPVFIGGGAIVTVLGLSMTLANPFRKIEKNGGDGSRTPRNMKAGSKSEQGYATDFLSAILMGLSNPGAIAVIFALMAFFGIAEQTPTDWSFFPVIVGVAAGSMGYWLGMTWLLSHFREKFNMRTIIWINRITGGIVIILGLATIAEGIMRIAVK